MCSHVQPTWIFRFDQKVEKLIMQWLFCYFKFFFSNKKGRDPLISYPDCLIIVSSVGINNYL